MGQSQVHMPVSPERRGSSACHCPAWLKNLSLMETAASETVNPILNPFNPKESEFW